MRHHLGLYSRWTAPAQPPMIITLPPLRYCLGECPVTEELRSRLSFLQSRLAALRAILFPERPVQFF